jgi:putative SOS response-associated peptidase YedK
MCGRYKFTPGEFADLRIRWNLDGDLPLFTSYNIAPTQNVPVIVQNEGRNHLESFRWGLVPFWAKDIAIGNQMINARAETLSEKPAFKRLVKDRRCLVPGDSFYEWRKEGKGKFQCCSSSRPANTFCVRRVVG